MTGYSPRAVRQIEDLHDYYVARDRLDAADNLHDAVEEAAALIEQNPDLGKPSPGPYPQVKRRGWAWVKSHRYWIAYRRRPALTIVAVFYDTADIPGRF